MSRFPILQRDIATAVVLMVLTALLVWRSVDVHELNRELRRARFSATHWHGTPCGRRKAKVGASWDRHR
jgi:hypothetical protein